MMMIQDIEPHKLYNEFEKDAAPEEGDLVCIFSRDQVLVRVERRAEGRLQEKPAPAKGELPEGAAKSKGDFPEKPATVRLPNVAEWLDFGCESRLTFLLRLDEQAIFLAEDLMEERINPVPEGFEYRSVRELRESGGKPLAFTVLTAYQLANWYRNNRFCGRCGSRTVHSKWERAIVCPSCSNTIYPRIVPAVIVAVTKGDQILLTKYANRAFTRYALVAGFTEIGETLEETVAREVMEEVGLSVRNIRYYKSQPWGIVDDILAGFFCDADGGEEIRLDRDELKEAVWVSRSEIPGEYEDYSLTNEMMMLFRDGKEPKGSIEMLPEEDNPFGRDADWLYEELPDGGAVLHGYIGETPMAGVVTLPERIYGKPVTALAGRIFNEYKMLEEVILPETVKKIGDGAFAICNRLERIVFPKELHEIPPDCFNECGFRKLVLPDTITRIRRGAFVNNRELEEIRLPNGLTEVEMMMFSGCKKLRRIEIPEGVTRIGDGAFSGCESLEEVILPESLTEIGMMAFLKCSKLRSVRIPSGVKKIGDLAFPEGIL